MGEKETLSVRTLGEETGKTYTAKEARAGIEVELKPNRELRLVVEKR